MIDPPQLNSICLYNYDNILIHLRAGSEDLIKVMSLKMGVKEEEPILAISKRHYVLGNKTPIIFRV